MVCLAILGVAGVGGLAAGLNARAGLPPGNPGASSSVAATMAASDIVNLRFPHEWVEPTPAADVVPRMLAFAGDDSSFTLFSPRPFYPISDIKAPAAETQAAEVPEAAKAKPAGQPRIALASASSKPVVLAARGQDARPAPAARSNAVLNDSQIASIKKRLNLTPDQERYWPAVEAELRKMEYKKAPQGTRTAQIDITKVDVRGTEVRRLPPGHELQRRAAPRAQVARPSPGTRQRDVEPLTAAHLHRYESPAVAPGFLFARRGR